MNFDNIKKWLVTRLTQIDDSTVGAGGTTLEDLQKEAEKRTVTPNVLANAPTELGRVLCYVREQRGWTRKWLASLADIDEYDIDCLETRADYNPGPRTLVRLADACGFSRGGFQELAKHVVPRNSGASPVERFAARSKNVGTITAQELDAIRTLVSVLSEKTVGGGH